jgi:hypothetical protein
MTVQGHRRQGPYCFEEAKMGWLCRCGHASSIFIGGDSGPARAYARAG